jgi:hypothetical protein
VFPEAYVSGTGLATADKFPQVHKWILATLLTADKFPQAYQLVFRFRLIRHGRIIKSAPTNCID